MSRGDRIVEQGAGRLEELSRRAAARGGLVHKLAQPLAEDADFLRKLKPSLVAARARGEQPVEPAPRTDLPQPVVRVEVPPEDGRGERRSPLPLIGAALGAGIATAKMLDWRGHAHPRD